jgi:hypothetical protein
MDRITIIQKSMVVFVCGIIGVLPVIGLLPAILAVIGWVRVRKNINAEWNPASLYLRLGALLASIGLVGTVVIGLACIAAYYGG